MGLLKQSTTYNRLVLMTLASDHVTGATGLTLTITASKNGAAFASIVPTVTERGNGWYSLALTTSHTDTIGILAMHITGSAADPTDTSDQVLVELPGQLSTTAVQAIWDAAVTALTTAGSIGKRIVDYLDAAVSSRGTSTYAGGAVASVTAGVTVAANNDKSGYSLDLTQAVPLSNTAHTVGDALNGARAQSFGKWVRAGTSLTLYAADGTTVVHVFTLDSATTPTSRV